MNIYDFMDKNPWLTFGVAFMACLAIGEVAAAFKKRK